MQATAPFATGQRRLRYSQATSPTPNATVHGTPSVSNSVLYQRHQSLTCRAHSRVAMDVMISGWSVSLFQASQQASTMAS